jgi:hypothetical protein
MCYDARSYKRQICREKLWFADEWPLNFMRLHFVSHSTLCRFVISGLRREVDENCAILGHHAASSGNFLPTFRDNLSVPSSRVKKMGPIFCLGTSVWNYHYSLRNNPEERSTLCLFVCLFVRLFVRSFVRLIEWFLTFRQDRLWTSGGCNTHGRHVAHNYYDAITANRKKEALAPTSVRSDAFSSCHLHAVSKYD